MITIDSARRAWTHAVTAKHRADRDEKATRDVLLIALLDRYTENRAAAAEANEQVDNDDAYTRHKLACADCLDLYQPGTHTVEHNERGRYPVIARCGGSPRELNA